MIKLIKSTFYKEDKTKQDLVHFIKEAKQLSFGKQCERFEKNFSKWQGRKYCVFVNSGSSANLALVQALLNLSWLRKGDKVAFSALTWSTNVMPLIQLGLVPIPIDVELSTLNISSKKLEEVLVKHEIKAVFVTNLLGFCGDLDRISEICRNKKIILLEDNCEALGSKCKGKLLGNFGLASTFSFYVGHHMSTIEGGAVCTDDEELYNMLCIVRAHGWSRNLSLKKQVDLNKRYGINLEFYSRYTFFDLGFNFRPTEIQGFLGNLQLKYLNEIIQKRNKNFLRIASKLYKNNSYYPVLYTHMDFVSNFAIPLICKSSKLKKTLVEKCKNKIEIRPIVGGNIVLQPFFQKNFPNAEFDLPNASLVHKNGFYFGNNPELTRKEIDFLIKTFS